MPGLTVEPLAIVSAPTVPAPASVAPLLTDTAELASDPLTSSVPALTVVPPLWGLVPDKVTVPVPCLVRVPVPLSTPAYVPFPLWLNTTAELFVMFPCKLVVVPSSVPALTSVPNA